MNQSRSSFEALLPGNLAPNSTCVVTLSFAICPSNSSSSIDAQWSMDAETGAAKEAKMRAVKTTEIFNRESSIVLMLKTRGIKYLISTQ